MARVGGRPYLAGMIGSTALVVAALASKTEGSFSDVVSVVGYSLSVAMLALALGQFVAVKAGPHAKAQTGERMEVVHEPQARHDKRRVRVTAEDLVAGAAPAAAPAAAAPAASGAQPADWYPDPRGEKRLRYWDGSRWTDHTAD